MVDLGPPTKLHFKKKLNHGPYATGDQDVISYNASRNRPVAVIKINEPISPILNYYEFEILDKGARSTIAIGAGSLLYPQGQQPGWTRDSIGYHADDGNLYHEQGFGGNFGPRCTTGDRMGCGIDFDSEPPGGNYVKVFFTKNGAQVGSSQRMKRPVHGLYPLFGLHSEGERIKYLGHWHVSPSTLQEMMRLEYSPSTYWIRSNGVRFLDNCLTLEYAAEGGNIQDCALAQANFPMSVTNHYFELEILDGGAGCSIAIGLAKLTYPLHKHPGWNPGAIGYHADDGKLFHERGMGREYGPTCAAGDIMGCGIRFQDSSDIIEESDESSSDSDTASIPELPLFGGGLGGYGNLFDSDDSDDERLARHFFDHGLLRLGMDHRQKQSNKLDVSRPKPGSGKKRSQKKVIVYFTRNGESLGDIECEIPSGGFYPVVGMLSRGEKIKVNLFPLSG